MKMNTVQMAVNDATLTLEEPNLRFIWGTSVLYLN